MRHVCDNTKHNSTILVVAVGFGVALLAQLLLQKNYLLAQHEI
jgi:hypothetical protein